MHFYSISSYISTLHFSLELTWRNSLFNFHSSYSTLHAPLAILHWRLLCICGFTHFNFGLNPNEPSWIFGHQTEINIIALLRLPHICNLSALTHIHTYTHLYMQAFIYVGICNVQLQLFVFVNFLQEFSTLEFVLQVVSLITHETQL